MSNLETFAEKELRLAGFFDKDAMYGGMLGDAIMKMIKVFSDEGHSGMSAGIAVSAFERVARFEPLTPLTGADDEWMEVGSDTWQNVRCSHVFKTSEGAYDIEGRIFREPSGSCYTSYESRTPVAFPYTPTREYVDVDENGQPLIPHERKAEL